MLGLFHAIFIASHFDFFSDENNGEVVDNLLASVKRQVRILNCIELLRLLFYLFHFINLVSSYTGTVFF